MMDPASLSAVAGAFFLVAVAPGPATLGCAAVSMGHGRRAGFAFGAGLGIGLAFWGVLAALGLGAILAAHAQVLIVLKLLGGAYLLWLAWQSGRSALSGPGAEAANIRSGRWLRRGLFLNLSNPKAVFAWLASLSLGLGPEASMGAVILATAVCAAIGFAIYVPWIVGFSHPPVMRLYRRFRFWVDGVVAALFAAAGLALIRSALMRAPS